MVYDWGAMAAREDRKTDRDRGQAKKRADIVSGKKKYKFRKKKGSTTRIRGRAEALRFIEADKTRRSLVTTRSFGSRLKEGLGVMGEAAKQIVTDPFGASQTTGLPMMGGTMQKAGASVIGAIPGIGRYLGRNVPEGALGRIIRVGGAAALGAAAGEGVDYLQRLQRGDGPMYPIAQMPSSRSIQPAGGGQSTMTMQQSPLGTLSRGQEFPGGPFVVKTWDTYPGPGVTGGGAWPIFALLSDGRIVVSKPNGSWKVYRPKKNLVISSNPRLRDIRKLDRMHKRVVKMIRRVVPPTRRK